MEISHLYQRKAKVPFSCTDSYDNRERNDDRESFF